MNINFNKHLNTLRIINTKYLMDVIFPAITNILQLKYSYSYKKVLITYNVYAVRGFANYRMINYSLAILKKTQILSSLNE